MSVPIVIEKAKKSKELLYNKKNLKAYLVLGIWLMFAQNIVKKYTRHLKVEKAQLVKMPSSNLTTLLMKRRIKHFVSLNDFKIL